MIASCAASHAEYSDNIKNKKTARHVIIQKKETPLHNVLRSHNIILANIQNGIKKRMNEICHIPVLPLYHTMYFTTNQKENPHNLLHNTGYSFFLFE